MVNFLFRATRFLFFLIVISFCLRFLLFYQIALSEVNLLNRNYLFGAVQIAEIFYVMNYSVKFYIYCLSGTLFRTQLRHSSIIDFIFFK